MSGQPKQRTRLYHHDVGRRHSSSIAARSHSCKRVCGSSREQVRRCLSHRRHVATARFNVTETEFYDGKSSCCQFTAGAVSRIASLCQRSSRPRRTQHVLSEKHSHRKRSTVAVARQCQNTSTGHRWCMNYRFVRLCSNYICCALLTLLWLRAPCSRWH